MQQYPYISYLTGEQIENFIKSKVIERLGEKRPILIHNWKYAPRILINFFVEVDTPKKGRHTTCGVAIIEDFKCTISIKGTSREYTKEWGQYVCDALNKVSAVNKYDPNDIFATINQVPTTKQYKQDYNAHWQKVKKEQIVKAEIECDEKLFK